MIWGSCYNRVTSRSIGREPCERGQLARAKSCNCKIPCHSAGNRSRGAEGRTCLDPGDFAADKEASSPAGPLENPWQNPKEKGSVLIACHVCGMQSHLIPVLRKYNMHHLCPSLGSRTLSWCCCPNVCALRKLDSAPPTTTPTWEFPVISRQGFHRPC